MTLSPYGQSDRSYRSGYEKGRADGYEKGRQEGFEKGYADGITAKALEQSAVIKPPSEVLNMLNEQLALKAEISSDLINLVWKELNLQQMMSESLGYPAVLLEDHNKCLKNTHKSSIWKLTLRVQEQIKSIILKIIKAKDKEREESQVELNMYLKASHIFKGSMPDIYYTTVLQEDTWVFMEFIRPIEGQLSFHPRYFDNIIPGLAQMHSLTYNERFYNLEHCFMPWIPIYNMREKMNYREKLINETMELINTAQEHSELKHLVKPYAKQLKAILPKGPLYFKELSNAGASIVHADLQLGNIGCNNLTEDAPWDIKFIDWEGAEFKPCWMDMANLIGVFLSYRSDWKEEEEDIVAHCAKLYDDEMKKLGIHFTGDPVKLYKMADVQRVLELGLFQQLRWALDKSYKGVLLESTLPRLIKWSGELDLLD